MRKGKFLIGGVIILLAIGSLGFLAFRGTAIYYYTVSEAIGQENTLLGQNIRVSGEVMPGSLEKAKPGNTIRFSLSDVKNADARLFITYRGVVPDTFKEGSEAVVEGRLAESDVFNAQRIIARCPSKYVPKE